jgi:hypothetical protein
LRSCENTKDMHGTITVTLKCAPEKGISERKGMMKDMSGNIGSA